MHSALTYAANETNYKGLPDIFVVQRRQSFALPIVQLVNGTSLRSFHERDPLLSRHLFVVSLQHFDAEFFHRGEAGQYLVMLPCGYGSVQDQAHKLVRFCQVKFVSQTKFRLRLDLDHPFEKFCERQEWFACGIEYTPNLIELFVNQLAGLQRADR